MQSIFIGDHKIIMLFVISNNKKNGKKNVLQEREMINCEKL